MAAQELMRLAMDIDQFIYHHDTYEYWDSVGEDAKSRKKNILETQKNLVEGKTEPIVTFLQSIIDDADEAQLSDEIAEAKELLRRLQQVEQNKAAAR
jgi:hypothetical protein